MSLTDLFNEFMERGEFVPSEYMRRARPQLFSDSSASSRVTLEKAHFEYVIDTLTARKQEQQFEDFCLRLAEAEICPNLKPQTGPTGGGDSKTDASTYPVASVLCERTYWVAPNPPANEHWAFAFSCKKQWKRKIREDVAKIAELERRFAKAFCITSQFVRDKARSQLELELSREYGTEVHILDRHWIIDRVTNHGRENIAIECLCLSGLQTSEKCIGPVDAQRLAEFERITSRLRTPLEFYATDYLLAADYRRAAILARSLERPRHEVDGLFHRGTEVARRHGDRKQILRCIYDHAWTSHWWYDDPQAVADAYSQLEQELPRLNDAEDIELLRNLLLILLGLTRMELLPRSTTRLSIRQSEFETRLDLLATDEQRPNNALYCESMLWLLRLNNAFARMRFLQQHAEPEDKQWLNDMFPQTIETFDNCCVKLESCLTRSAGLAIYPFETVVAYVSQLAESIKTLEPAFEHLFEHAARLLRDRKGEAAEGEMLLQRGTQLAESGHPLEALVLLGKARTHLNKSTTVA